MREFQMKHWMIVPHIQILKNHKVIKFKGAVLCSPELFDVENGVMVNKYLNHKEAFLSP